MTKSSASDWKNTLYCSFCGKSKYEVKRLIAGPTVFICNECVEKCVEVILDGAREDDEEFARLEKLERDRQVLHILNMKSPMLPEGVREWPKERVAFVHRSIRSWRSYQHLLIEACPPDMEIDKYIGEHLTQEEAYRLFKQACRERRSSLEDGMRMIFDPITEQIAAPFDRVVKLLRLARDDQPDVPL